MRSALKAYGEANARALTATFRRTVVASPTLGLGNRLFCLASCLRYAQRANKQLELNWVRDPSACPIAFDGLLRNALPTTTARRPHFLLTKYGIWLTQAEGRAVGVRNFLPFGRSFLFPHELYEHLPATARRDYAAIFAAFRPIAAIDERVERVVDAIGNRSFFGVHARHGDFVSLGWSASTESLVAAIRHRLESGWGDGFFLACDSEATEVTLRQTFGDRCLTMSNRVLLRTDPENVAVGFAEMLTLGRLQRLILSPASSFSVAAWMFTGGEAEIDFPDDGPAWGRRARGDSQPRVS